jgi:hypothetical protein
LPVVSDSFAAEMTRRRIRILCSCSVTAEAALGAMSAVLFLINGRNTRSHLASCSRPSSSSRFHHLSLCLSWRGWHGGGSGGEEDGKQRTGSGGDTGAGQAGVHVVEALCAGVAHSEGADRLLPLPERSAGAPHFIELANQLGEKQMDDHRCSSLPHSAGRRCLTTSWPRVSPCWARLLDGHPSSIHARLHDSCGLFVDSCTRLAPARLLVLSWRPRLPPHRLRILLAKAVAFHS